MNILTPALFDPSQNTEIPYYVHPGESLMVVLVNPAFNGLIITILGQKIYGRDI